MTRAAARCLRCQHFYVTWDPRFPRGCRAMGFKSRELPAQAVRAASGEECLRFEEKVAREPRGGGRKR